MHAFSYIKGRVVRIERQEDRKCCYYWRSHAFIIFSREKYIVYFHTLFLSPSLSISIVYPFYLLIFYIFRPSYFYFFFFFFITETFVSFYAPSCQLLFANTFPILMQTPHRSSLRSRIAL